MVQLFVRCVSNCGLVSHPYRLVSMRYHRVSDFHGGNTGSNPVGDANKINNFHEIPVSFMIHFDPLGSLSNAFTSAFKKLDPVPQFKATAKLGVFLTQLPINL